MMNPSFVQKGSVAASEIDQPKLADVLQMDERMLSRNLRRIQNDAVRAGPPERRTAVKRVALAIGGLQPGSLLFGCVHDSVSYKKSWPKQSISDGGLASFRQI